MAADIDLKELDKITGFTGILEEFSTLVKGYVTRVDKQLKDALNKVKRASVAGASGKNVKQISEGIKTKIVTIESQVDQSVQQILTIMERVVTSLKTGETTPHIVQTSNELKKALTSVGSAVDENMKQFTKEVTKQVRTITGDTSFELNLNENLFQDFKKAMTDTSIDTVKGILKQHRSKLDKTISKMKSSGQRATQKGEFGIDIVGYVKKEDKFIDEINKVSETKLDEYFTSRKGHFQTLLKKYGKKKRIFPFEKLSAGMIGGSEEDIYEGITRAAYGRDLIFKHLLDKYDKNTAKRMTDEILNRGTRLHEFTMKQAMKGWRPSGLEGASLVGIEKGVVDVQQNIRGSMDLLFEKQGKQIVVELKSVGAKVFPKMEEMIRAGKKAGKPPAEIADKLQRKFKSIGANMEKYNTQLDFYVLQKAKELNVPVEEIAKQVEGALYFVAEDSEKTGQVKSFKFPYEFNANRIKQAYQKANKVRDKAIKFLSKDKTIKQISLSAETMAKLYEEIDTVMDKVGAETMKDAAGPSKGETEQIAAIQKVLKCVSGVKQIKRDAYTGAKKHLGVLNKNMLEVMGSYLHIAKTDDIAALLSKNAEERAKYFAGLDPKESQKSIALFQSTLKGVFSTKRRMKNIFKEEKVGINAITEGMQKVQFMLQESLDKFGDPAINKQLATLVNQIKGGKAPGKSVVEFPESKKVRQDVLGYLRKLPEGYTSFIETFYDSQRMQTRSLLHIVKGEYGQFEKLRERLQERTRVGSVVSKPVGYQKSLGGGEAIFKGEDVFKESYEGLRGSVKLMERTGQDIIRTSDNEIQNYDKTLSRVLQKKYNVSLEKLQTVSKEVGKTDVPKILGISQLAKHEPASEVDKMLGSIMSSAGRERVVEELMDPKQGPIGRLFHSWFDQMSKSLKLEDMFKGMKADKTLGWKTQTVPFKGYEDFKETMRTDLMTRLSKGLGESLYSMGQGGAAGGGLEKFLTKFIKANFGGQESIDYLKKSLSGIVNAEEFFTEKTLSNMPTASAGGGRRTSYDKAIANAVKMFRHMGQQKRETILTKKGTSEAEISAEMGKFGELKDAISTEFNKLYIKAAEQARLGEGAEVTGGKIEQLIYQAVTRVMRKQSGAYESRVSPITKEVTSSAKMGGFAADVLDKAFSQISVMAEQAAMGKVFPEKTQALIPGIEEKIQLQKAHFDKDEGKMIKPEGMDIAESENVIIDTLKERDKVLFDVVTDFRNKVKAYLEKTGKKKAEGVSSKELIPSLAGDIKKLADESLLQMRQSMMPTKMVPKEEQTAAKSFFQELNKTIGYAYSDIAAGKETGKTARLTGETDPKAGKLLETIQYMTEGLQKIRTEFKGEQAGASPELKKVTGQFLSKEFDPLVKRLQKIKKDPAKIVQEIEKFQKALNTFVHKSSIDFAAVDESQFTTIEQFIGSLAQTVTQVSTQELGQTGKVKEKKVDMKGRFQENFKLIESNINKYMQKGATYRNAIYQTFTDMFKEFSPEKLNVGQMERAIRDFTTMREGRSAFGIGEQKISKEMVSSKDKITKVLKTVLGSADPKELLMKTFQSYYQSGDAAGQVEKVFKDTPAMIASAMQGVTMTGAGGAYKVKGAVIQQGMINQLIEKLKSFGIEIDENVKKILSDSIRGRIKGWAETMTTSKKSLFEYLLKASASAQEESRVSMTSVGMAGDDRLLSRDILSSVKQEYGKETYGKGAITSQAMLHRKIPGIDTGAPVAAKGSSDEIKKEQDAIDGAKQSVDGMSGALLKKLNLITQESTALQNEGPIIQNVANEVEVLGGTFDKSVVSSKNLGGTIKYAREAMKGLGNSAELEVGMASGAAFFEKYVVDTAAITKEMSYGVKHLFEGAEPGKKTVKSLVQDFNHLKNVIKDVGKVWTDSIITKAKRKGIVPTKEEVQLPGSKEFNEEAEKTERTLKKLFKKAGMKEGEKIDPTNLKQAKALEKAYAGMVKNKEIHIQKDTERAAQAKEYLALLRDIDSYYKDTIKSSKDINLTFSERLSATTQMGQAVKEYGAALKEAEKSGVVDELKLKKMQGVYKRMQAKVGPEVQRIQQIMGAMGAGRDDKQLENVKVQMSMEQQVESRIKEAVQNATQLKSLYKTFPELQKQNVIYTEKVTGAQNKQVASLDISISKLGKIKVFLEDQAKGMYKGGPMATFGNVMKRMALYSSGGFMYFGALRLARNIQKTIMDVELGMAKLRQIMDETTTDFNDMLGSAFGIADKYGMEISKVVEVMNDYARMGLKQAEVISMTETAVLGVNVGFKDTRTAMDYLTSMVRQFNMETERSIDVLNMLVTVADRNATTVQDIGEAFKHTGAAAAAAGVKVEELIAMIATLEANTRLKGSMIGRALRRIISRAHSEEASTMLEKMGVSVYDVAGRYRSFTKILADVAGQWKGLTNVQQENLARQIAQQRYYNFFIVLMNKWSEVNKGVLEAQNSQGAAYRKNAEIMDSYAKQVARAKQEMAKLYVELGRAGILDMLRGVTAAARGFAKLLSMIPTPIKAIVGGIGLIKLGFMGIGWTLQLYFRKNLAEVLTMTKSWIGLGTVKEKQDLTSVQLLVKKLAAENGMDVELKKQNISKGAGIKQSNIELGIREKQLLTESMITKERMAQGGVGSAVAGNAALGLGMTGVGASTISQEQMKMHTDMFKGMNYYRGADIGKKVMDGMNASLKTGAKQNSKLWKTMITPISFGWGASAKKGAVKTGNALFVAFKGILKGLVGTLKFLFTTPLGLLVTGVGATTGIILHKAYKDAKKTLDSIKEETQAAIDFTGKALIDAQSMMDSYKLATIESARGGIETLQGLTKQRKIIDEMSLKFPELVSGWDAYGNAILLSTSNAEALSGQMRVLTKQYKEQQTALGLQRIRGFMEVPDAPTSFFGFVGIASDSLKDKIKKVTEELQTLKGSLAESRAEEDVEKQMEVWDTWKEKVKILSKHMVEMRKINQEAARELRNVGKGGEEAVLRTMGQLFTGGKDSEPGEDFSKMTEYNRHALAATGNFTKLQQSLLATRVTLLSLFEGLGNAMQEVFLGSMDNIEEGLKPKMFKNFTNKFIFAIKTSGLDTGLKTALEEMTTSALEKGELSVDLSSLFTAQDTDALQGVFREMGKHALMVREEVGKGMDTQLRQIAFTKEGVLLIDETLKKEKDRYKFLKYTEEAVEHVKDFYKEMGETKTLQFEDVGMDRLKMSLGSLTKIMGGYNKDLTRTKNLYSQLSSIQERWSKIQVSTVKLGGYSYIEQVEALGEATRSAATAFSPMSGIFKTVGQDMDDFLRSSMALNKLKIHIKLTDAAKEAMERIRKGDPRETDYAVVEAAYNRAGLTTFDKEMEEIKKYQVVKDKVQQGMATSVGQFGKVSSEVYKKEKGFLKEVRKEIDQTRLAYYKFLRTGKGMPSYMETGVQWGRVKKEEIPEGSKEHYAGIREFQNVFKAVDNANDLDALIQVMLRYTPIVGKMVAANKEYSESGKVNAEYVKENTLPVLEKLYKGLLQVKKGYEGKPPDLFKFADKGGAEAVGIKIGLFINKAMNKIGPGVVVGAIGKIRSMTIALWKAGGKDSFGFEALIKGATEVGQKYSDIMDSLNSRINKYTVSLVKSSDAMQQLYISSKINASLAEKENLRTLSGLKLVRGIYESYAKKHGRGEKAKEETQEFMKNLTIEDAYKKITKHYKGEDKPAWLVKMKEGDQIGTASGMITDAQAAMQQMAEAGGDIGQTASNKIDEANQKYMSTMGEFQGFMMSMYQEQVKQVESFSSYAQNVSGVFAEGMKKIYSLEGVRELEKKISEDADKTAKVITKNVDHKLRKQIPAIRKSFERNMAAGFLIPVAKIENMIAPTMKALNLSRYFAGEKPYEKLSKGIEDVVKSLLSLKDVDLTTPISELASKSQTGVEILKKVEKESEGLFKVGYKINFGPDQEMGNIFGMSDKKEKEYERKIKNYDVLIKKTQRIKKRISELIGTKKEDELDVETKGKIKYYTGEVKSMKGFPIEEAKMFDPKHWETQLGLTEKGFKSYQEKYKGMVSGFAKGMGKTAKKMMEELPSLESLFISTAKKLSVLDVEKDKPIIEETKKGFLAELASIASGTEFETALKKTDIKNKFWLYVNKQLKEKATVTNLRFEIGDFTANIETIRDAIFGLYGALAKNIENVFDDSNRTYTSGYRNIWMSYKNHGIKIIDDVSNFFTSSMKKSLKGAEETFVKMGIAQKQAQENLRYTEKEVKTKEKEIAEDLDSGKDTTKQQEELQILIKKKEGLEQIDSVANKTLLTAGKELVVQKKLNQEFESLTKIGQVWEKMRKTINVVNAEVQVFGKEFSMLDKTLEYVRSALDDLLKAAIDQGNIKWEDAVPDQKMLIENLRDYYQVLEKLKEAYDLQIEGITSMSDAWKEFAYGSKGEDPVTTMLKSMRRGRYEKYVKDVIEDLRKQLGEITPFEGIEDIVGTHLDANLGKMESIFKDFGISVGAFADAVRGMSRTTDIKLGSQQAMAQAGAHIQAPAGADAYSFKLSGQEMVLNPTQQQALDVKHPGAVGFLKGMLPTWRPGAGFAAGGMGASDELYQQAMSAYINKDKKKMQSVEKSFSQLAKRDDYYKKIKRVLDRYKHRAHFLETEEHLPITKEQEVFRKKRTSSLKKRGLLSKDLIDYVDLEEEQKPIKGVKKEKEQLAGLSTGKKAANLMGEYAAKIMEAIKNREQAKSEGKVEWKDRMQDVIKEYTVKGLAVEKKTGVANVVTYSGYDKFHKALFYDNQPKLRPESSLQTGAQIQAPAGADKYSFKLSGQEMVLNPMQQQALDVKHPGAVGFLKNMLPTWKPGAGFAAGGMGASDKLYQQVMRAYVNEDRNKLSSLEKTFFQLSKEDERYVDIKRIFDKYKHKTHFIETGEHLPLTKEMTEQREKKEAYLEKVGRMPKGYEAFKEKNKELAMEGRGATAGWEDTLSSLYNFDKPVKKDETYSGSLLFKDVMGSMAKGVMNIGDFILPTDVTAKRKPNLPNLLKKVGDWFSPKKAIAAKTPSIEDDEEGILQESEKKKTWMDVYYGKEVEDLRFYSDKAKSYYAEQRFDDTRKMTDRAMDAGKGIKEKKAIDKFHKMDEYQNAKELRYKVRVLIGEIDTRSEKEKYIYPEHAYEDAIEDLHFYKKRAQMYYAEHRLSDTKDMIEKAMSSGKGIKEKKDLSGFYKMDEYQYVKNLKDEIKGIEEKIKKSEKGALIEKVPIKSKDTLWMEHYYGKEVEDLRFYRDKAGFYYAEQRIVDTKKMIDRAMDAGKGIKEKKAIDKFYKMDEYQYIKNLKDEIIRIEEKIGKMKDERGEWIEKVSLPKFHTGGIAGNRTHLSNVLGLDSKELLAILHEGEAVIPESRVPYVRAKAPEALTGLPVGNSNGISIPSFKTGKNPDEEELIEESKVITVINMQTRKAINNIKELANDTWDWIEKTANQINDAATTTMDGVKIDENALKKASGAEEAGAAEKTVTFLGDAAKVTGRVLCRLTDEIGMATLGIGKFVLNAASMGRIDPKEAKQKEAAIKMQAMINNAEEKHQSNIKKSIEDKKGLSKKEINEEKQKIMSAKGRAKAWDDLSKEQKKAEMEKVKESMGWWQKIQATAAAKSKIAIASYAQKFIEQATTLPEAQASSIEGIKGGGAARYEALTVERSPFAQAQIQEGMNVGATIGQTAGAALGPEFAMVGDVAGSIIGKAAALDAIPDSIKDYVKAMDDYRKATLENEVAMIGMEFQINASEKALSFMEKALEDTTRKIGTALTTFGQGIDNLTIGVVDFYGAFEESSFALSSASTGLLDKMSVTAPEIKGKETEVKGTDIMSTITDALGIGETTTITDMSDAYASMSTYIGEVTESFITWRDGLVGSNAALGVMHTATASGADIMKTLGTHALAASKHLKLFSEVAGDGTGDFSKGIKLNLDAIRRPFEARMKFAQQEIGMLNKRKSINESMGDAVKKQMGALQGISFDDGGMGGGISGVLSGAMMGAAVAGPVGAAVGGVLGGLLGGGEDKEEKKEREMQKQQAMMETLKAEAETARERMQIECDIMAKEQEIAQIREEMLANLEKYVNQINDARTAVGDQREAWEYVGGIVKGITANASEVGSSFGSMLNMFSELGDSIDAFASTFGATIKDTRHMATLLSEGARSYKLASRKEIESGAAGGTRDPSYALGQAMVSGASNLISIMGEGVALTSGQIEYLMQVAPDVAQKVATMSVEEVFHAVREYTFEEGKKIAAIHQKTNDMLLRTMVTGMDEMAFTTEKYMGIMADVMKKWSAENKLVTGGMEEAIGKFSTKGEYVEGGTLLGDLSGVTSTTEAFDAYNNAVKDSIGIYQEGAHGFLEITDEAKDVYGEQILNIRNYTEALQRQRTGTEAVMSARFAGYGYGGGTLDTSALEAVMLQIRGDTSLDQYQMEALIQELVMDNDKLMKIDADMLSKQNELVDYSRKSTELLEKIRESYTKAFGAPEKERQFMEMNLRFLRNMQHAVDPETGRLFLTQTGELNKISEAEFAALKQIGEGQYEIAQTFEDFDKKYGAKVAGEGPKDVSTWTEVRPITNNVDINLDMDFLDPSQLSADRQRAIAIMVKNALIGEAGRFSQ